MTILNTVPITYFIFLVILGPSVDIISTLTLQHSREVDSNGIFIPILQRKIS